MKKVYKTMQGRIVDLDNLTTKNELTPAIGNAKVNARGDELGPGGRIVRRREEILADYYRNNPNAVPDEIIKRRPNVMPQTAPADATPVDELVSEDTPPQTDITKRKRNGE
jgi:hypothetical protein